jgi:hypothetical protein
MESTASMLPQPWNPTCEKALLAEDFWAGIQAVPRSSIDAPPGT